MIALERLAEFYEIDMIEAQRRWDVVGSHAGDPHDPICVGCAQRPEEMPEYDYLLDASREINTRADVVMCEEGTYNPANGHFLCDECYIRNGMPSNDRGWVCP